MTKIYIDTLGCFKNQEDSERAAGLLAEGGCCFTENEAEAEIIIVNTCGFIEDAKRESIDRILELLPLKENGAKLVVTGCLVQRYAAELAEELPEVDAFLGVNDYGTIAETVRILMERDDTTRDGSDLSHAHVGTDQNRPGLSPMLCKVDGEAGLLTGPRKALTPRAVSYLKVAEGCSNRCAYCAIPAIRGPYRSVPMEDVLADAERLAGEGAKELVLIAQDVSAWGIDLYGEYRLPELLTALCRIDGPEWIRLMYCYEERITDKLIETIAHEDKICKYIDIPIQHCADSVLRRMNRRSTHASIEMTIKKLRDAVPDIAIRTTLMTGFPGETEEDFEELKDFVRMQRFERLGVFAFSPEEGTPAADMDDQISRETAEERRDSLMLLQMDISLENNRARVGRTLKTFTEEMEETGIYVGRTEFDAPEIDNQVLFTAPCPLAYGTFVQVRIEDAMDYDLVGAVCS
ncbi:MAG: 30S ribosomal protein S12 methylthiotransferase RimO [Clostridiales Family XIII bacterium]|jgi:ribosomal protein S12 methylthiotransferase|nr:30S ribosomal protein S12 methylthiotransferase RimO [Clostridiales Family XIII bacterium]